MESTRSKTKSDKSRSKDKNKDKKSQVADETEPFLHLMAFADINSLLHPGGIIIKFLLLYFIQDIMYFSTKM